MESKEDMQNKSSQAVYKLIANENKDLKEKLDWADRQLDSMADKLEKKNKLIIRLTDLLLEFTN